MSVSCNMFRFQTWTTFGAHCDFCRPTVTLKKRPSRISYYKPLKLQHMKEIYLGRITSVWNLFGYGMYVAEYCLTRGEACLRKEMRWFRKYILDVLQNRKVHYCVFMNLTLDRILNQMNPICRSQWPRELRCGSAAARLPGVWVRIPSEAWMSVSCECCVLSGRDLCRADHSSRGVLPSVVRLCSWSLVN
jgi:hypothetical protein